MDAGDEEEHGSLVWTVGYLPTLQILKVVWADANFLWIHRFPCWVTGFTVLDLKNPLFSLMFLSSEISPLGYSVAVMSISFFESRSRSAWWVWEIITLFPPERLPEQLLAPSKLFGVSPTHLIFLGIQFFFFCFLSFLFVSLCWFNRLTFAYNLNFQVHFQLQIQNVLKNIITQETQTL